MKIKALFMPEGNILAHVGRVLAIADALESVDDVEVCFAASGKHASWLADSGREIYPVYTRDHSELLSKLVKGGNSFVEKELSRYVEDEIRVLNLVKPDVVIGDYRPSLGISARLMGVPHVCINNAVWTKYCDFKKFDPPESWLPTRIFGKKLVNLFRPIGEKAVFKHYAAPFNAVCRKYDLPPFEDIRDCMSSGDLNLLADIPEFFPTVGLPSNFRYIGPILWEPEMPDPEWLSRIDPEKKTVYLTMGSTGPLKTMEGIAKKLLDMDFQVVCTTATETLEGCEENGNLYSAPYAPGGKLCELADVVVCHAGNGTVYQALSHGTPVVAMPLFHDQEFNVQRVEALRLGCRVMPGSHSAEKVGPTVDAILSNGYRNRALDFQRLLKRWNGPKNAAAAIRKFVGPAERLSYIDDNIVAPTVGKMTLEPWVVTSKPSVESVWGGSTL